VQSTDVTKVWANVKRRSQRPLDSHARVTRDRCYDFLNIFAEKFSENIGVFLLKTKLNYAKIGS
jgi:hypothetical protein